MRVIVCGSREFPGFELNEVRYDIIANRLFELPTDTTIVHGAARGADRMAGQEAEKLGLLIEEHPADWDTYGKSAGYRRNELMASLGADLCIAFWNGESRGTQHMIDLAKRYGIEVEVVKVQR